MGNGVCGMADREDDRGPRRPATIQGLGQAGRALQCTGNTGRDQTDQNRRGRTYVSTSMPMPVPVLKCLAPDAGRLRCSASSGHCFSGVSRVQRWNCTVAARVHLLLWLYSLYSYSVPLTFRGTAEIPVFMSSRPATISPRRCQIQLSLPFVSTKIPS
jgi:hypothetical protein